MPNTPGSTLVGSPIEISNQTDTPIARANQVTVDAASFSGNLSPTDTLVQTALETIDALSIGGTGDVTGPGSSVDENFAVFDGTTGKIIQDINLNEAYFIAMSVAL